MHKVEKLTAQAWSHFQIPQSRDWLTLEMAREVIFYIMSRWDGPKIQRKGFAQRFETQVGLMRTATVKRNELVNIIRGMLQTARARE